VAKIFSLGNTCLDVALQNTRDVPKWGTETFFREAEFRLGGQGTNFAIAASKLGMTSLLISSVGGDRIGQWFTSELNEVPRLDTRFLRKTQLNTGCTVAAIRTDGERLFLTSLNHQKDYRLNDDEVARIMDMSEKGDVFHVSGYFMLPGLQRGLPSFLRKLRSRDVRVSFDPGWGPKSARSRILELLPLVDYFEPNELELLQIVGAGNSTTEAARKLSRRYEGVLALKLGKKGSSIFLRGDPSARIDPFRTNIVDTVGAGDVFDAGFVLGIISGKPLESSARLGNGAASIAISRTGEPFTRFPSYSEVSNLINKNKGSLFG
jgi:sugar/nucleoside kinase (ribokinase family)